MIMGVGVEGEGQSVADAGVLPPAWEVYPSVGESLPLPPTGPTSDNESPKC